MSRLACTLSLSLGATALLATASVSAQVAPVLIDSIQDCDDCPVMVEVPAGEFSMGTAPGGYEAVEPTGEQPAVKLVVPEPFLIGEAEITQRQFEAFVRHSGHETTGSCRTWAEGRWTTATSADWRSKPAGAERGADYPVTCVSWRDASAYARWLSETTGKAYSLPSEAEWEYAARGGVAAPRWWGWNSFEGVSISDACEHANVFDVDARPVYPFPWPHARCRDGYAQVAPIKSFDANAYGLFDAIGNVWEWTADCYTASYANRPRDARAWKWSGGCEARPIRGGAWSSRPLQSRATNRAHRAADYRAADLGFRVTRRR